MNNYAGELNGPEDISQTDMDRLADALSAYLKELENIMVIPDELIDDGKKFRNAIDNVKKLIKRLRKGDKSVFKDGDDWNNVI